MVTAANTVLEISRDQGKFTLLKGKMPLVLKQNCVYLYRPEAIFKKKHTKIAPGSEILISSPAYHDRVIYYTVAMDGGNTRLYAPLYTSTPFYVSQNLKSNNIVKCMIFNERLYCI
jgi:hypothetical protein